MKTKTLLLSTLLVLFGCSYPQSGPDKTLEGTALGAGWGAGAGAVIGNQVATAGLGAGAGAGFGAAAGLLTGASFDRMEGQVLRQQRELEALNIRTRANFQKLSEMQESLDNASGEGSVSGIYQVFFDDDSTSLKSGSVANLQVIAESIKSHAGATTVYVVGHADDAGTPDYNKRISEARAREVSGYLASRGISLDQIKVSSHGSERPIATNATAEGRQLNRRVDIYLGN